MISKMCSQLKIKSIGNFLSILPKGHCIILQWYISISLKYYDTVATQQFLILCFSYYEKLEDSGVQFKLIIDFNRYPKQFCSNDLF